LPELPEGGAWTPEIDTTGVQGDPPAASAQPADTYPLQGRSLVVLRQLTPETTKP
jgi:hypothetical protein